MSTASNNQLNYQVRPFFQAKSICIAERTGFSFTEKKNRNKAKETIYEKH